MIDATPLLRAYARWRAGSLARQNPARTQERQLLRLVRRAVQRERRMNTVRLTMAQALVRYLCAQHIETEGRNEPLVRTLGAEPRPLRAYYSVGMYNVEQIGGLVDETLSQGFTGLKIKLGFPTLAEDLAVVRAARRVGANGDLAELC